MANVLLNPSFETDTTDWSLTNGNQALDASTASDGITCNRLTSTVDTGNMTLYCEPYPAAEGEAWSCGIDVQNLTHTGNIRADLRFLDDTGAEITGGGGLGTSTDITTGFESFARVKNENKVAPAGTVSVRMRLVVLAPALDAELLVDAAQLEQGTTLPAYNPVIEPPPAAGVNLLVNSSFELDFGGLSEHDTPPANWEGNPVEARTRTTVPDAVHGSYVGILDNPDGRNAPNWQSEARSAENNLVEGDVVTGSIYFRKRSGTDTFTLRLDVQFFDATDAPISPAAIGANFTPATDWDRATCTGTAPAGTTHAQLRVTLQGAVLGDSVEIDAAQLELGPAATAYAVNPAEVVKRNLTIHAIGAPGSPLTATAPGTVLTAEQPSTGWVAIEPVTKWQAGEPTL